MDGKGILSAIVSLVIFIIFAIIYFIILGFIIKVGADLIGEGKVSADMIAVAASILTAGTLIAGGSIKDSFKL
ncbi:MAG: hypothetical protein FWC52_02860 [Candidatus Methanoplasma sp.]|nr:hypothetical protein [Candidatus Methanoplasma sp.]